LQKQIDILLVEDDRDDVELLEASLRESGVLYTRTIIAHGDQVFPFLSSAEKLPDIIVLDLNLPKMHGKDILTLLKANADLAAVPVMVLTTSSVKEERNYCLKAGARQYHIKPVNMRDFKPIIEGIIWLTN
jgi:DNA-binding response OmpR family regulator